MPLNIGKKWSTPEFPVFLRIQGKTKPRLPRISHQPSCFIGKEKGLPDQTAFSQKCELLLIRFGKHNVRHDAGFLQVLHGSKPLEIIKNAAGGCDQDNHNHRRNTDQQVLCAVYAKHPLFHRL